MADTALESSRPSWVKPYRKCDRKRLVPLHVFVVDVPEVAPRRDVSDAEMRFFYHETVMGAMGGIYFPVHHNAHRPGQIGRFALMMCDKRKAGHVGLSPGQDNVPAGSLFLADL